MARVKLSKSEVLKRKKITDKNWYLKNKAHKQAYDKARRAKLGESLKKKQRERYLLRRKRAIKNANNWRFANPEKAALIRQNWAKRNKEKRYAQSCVASALKKGALKKRPCEKCSCKKVDAHHDDYTKPLKVRWLCRKHHLELHRIDSKK